MDALTRYEMIENDYMIQRMVLKIKTNQQSLFVIFDKVILTMAKKNQTVISFAHKSFENSPSVLKFLLKLLFSIIKHH